MPDIIIQSSVSAVPSPAIDISFRIATLADLPAIDALQKKYHKQLGFFPRAQMEGYLKNGWVVVAEGRHEGTACPEQRRGEARRHEGEDATSAGTARSELAPCPSPLAPALLGYCASRDRYLKRDELGVIYQLCVDPRVQRKFIGAALLRAVFERAPYGCKLYCCWCAQDIAANYFWEMMGFVPLAFRAGSRGRRRVHIFWQKRIVEGDTATQYWFPSQTGGGAMGEDRLVLPIPPGTRWVDEMPRILPQAESPEAEDRSRKQIESPILRAPKPKALRIAPPTRKALGGWSFAPPTQVAPAAPAPAPARKPRERVKNDPKLIAAARELRDRWLEEVNAGNYLPVSAGKYEVGRRIVAHPVERAMLIEHRLVA